MNKKIILLVFDIILSITGIICLSASLAQEDKNQVLLSVGLICNSISLVMWCITSRKKREEKTE